MQFLQNCSMRIYKGSTSLFRTLVLTKEIIYSLQTHWFTQEVCLEPVLMAGESPRNFVHLHVTYSWTTHDTRWVLDLNSQRTPRRYYRKWFRRRLQAGSDWSTGLCSCCCNRKSIIHAHVQCMCMHRAGAPFVTLINSIVHHIHPAQYVAVLSYHFDIPLWNVREPQMCLSVPTR